MKPIIVGVDGSDGAQLALEWAAAEARLRGASLHVLLAWQLPVGLAAGGGGWVAITPELVGDLQKLAEKRLDDACRAAGAALDGVDVERKALEGAAPSVLLDAAAGADLLVVGTRGHGGFAGLLLGSVSQQCVHHSPCPIVIVPSRD